jgi:YggT family protein
VRDIANVVHVVLNILEGLIILRVILSWFPGIDPWHPAMRLLRAIVDPILRPFRGILPTFAGGIDVTPLLAIIVLRGIDRAVYLYSVGAQLDFIQFLLFAVEDVVLAVIAIMAIIVFLRMVISMLQADPWHPTVRMIREMSRPLVQPFAGILPKTRSVDTAAVTSFVVLVAGYFIVQAILDRLIVHV